MYNDVYEKLMKLQLKLKDFDTKEGYMKFPLHERITLKGYMKRYCHSIAIWKMIKFYNL